MIRSAVTLVVLAGSVARAGIGFALTMEEAIGVAVANNPEIRAAEGELAVARARAQGAALWFQDNPTFEGEAGQRDAHGDRFLDYSVAVTQAIDVSGQRGARVAAGTAAVSAAEARLAAQRARTAAATQEAFGRVLASAAERRLADEGYALAAEALGAAEERQRAGDASLLEVNTARMEVGRSSRDKTLAAQREQLARGALKLLVNAEPELALAVEGDLADFAARGASGTTRGDAQPAATVRPELVAARHDLEAAKGAERLAERETIARPRLGASYRREEDVPIVQAVLSVELPLFNRNDAARAEARARVAQAGALVAAVERQTTQELEQARARYAAAGLALESYQVAVVSAAEENVSLATEGYREGKLDFLQLSLIRRGSLEVRRGRIEALEELNAADAALRRALGGMDPSR
jgi:cobalt-zinc-cadmium efflux system outer membrane protein